MTEAEQWAAYRQARARGLTLYLTGIAILLIAIGVLALYSFRLGALVGPGVESSFGIAASLMFIMGALIVHLVDRLYRSWPFGRRFTPTAPGPVTDLGWAHLIAAIVIITAAGGIAYVLGGILA